MHERTIDFSPFWEKEREGENEREKEADNVYSILFFSMYLIATFGTHANVPKSSPFLSEGEGWRKKTRQIRASRTPDVFPGGFRSLSPPLFFPFPFHVPAEQKNSRDDKRKQGREVTLERIRWAIISSHIRNSRTHSKIHISSSFHIEEKKKNTRKYSDRVAFENENVCSNKQHYMASIYEYSWIF